MYCVGIGRTGQIGVGWLSGTVTSLVGSRFIVLFLCLFAEVLEDIAGA